MEGPFRVIFGGVVDESIKDGVGEGSVTDDRMPVIERQLTGQEGGTVCVAILEDLQQVPPFRIGQSAPSQNHRG
jgi:hypothetical protein